MTAALVGKFTSHAAFVGKFNKHLKLSRKTFRSKLSANLETVLAAM